MMSLLWIALGWSAIVFAVLALTGNITSPFGAIVKYDAQHHRAYDPRAKMSVAYLGGSEKVQGQHRFKYEYAGQSHEFESTPSRLAELNELIGMIDGKAAEGPQRSLAIEAAFLDFSAQPDHRQRFNRQLFVRLLKEVVPPANHWKSVSVDLMQPDGTGTAFRSHAGKRFRRRPIPKSEPPPYKSAPGKIELSFAEVRDLRHALSKPLPPIEYDAETKRAFDPATGMAIRYLRGGYPMEGDDYYVFEVAGHSAEFDGRAGYDEKLRRVLGDLESKRRLAAHEYRRHGLHRINMDFLAVRLLPHDLIPKVLSRFADIFRVCAGRYGATIWVTTTGDFPHELGLSEEVPDLDLDDFNAWLERRRAERPVAES